MRYVKILTLALILMQGCQKDTDYGLEGELPSAPEFSIQAVPDDPNRFVVTDLSSGNFARLWEFTDGLPKTSTRLSDTVTYKKKGVYEVSLHISSETGSGTAVSKQEVVVEEDAAGCPFAMLNEDCTTTCWRLSGEEAGVMVGPSPFSGEWFTSDNITANQADDRWCFSEDGSLEYNNNGASFSACQGFVDDENYPVPDDLSFDYEEGAGFDASDQFIIDGIYMGVEDSGPAYDIVELTETKMVVLTPIKPCDGTPSPGWFTLTFFKAE